MNQVKWARTAALGVMLVLPVFGFSYRTLDFRGAGITIVHADDSNGDVHSNCHTGSKFRGAGGNDKSTLDKTSGGVSCEGNIN